MRKVLSLVMASLLLTGNAFAQSNQQIDEEFYKQVPKNAHLHGKLQTTITTDMDLRDSRLKAGRAAVGKLYDEFAIVLELATLSDDGKVLIEDGALAYGKVIYSRSYLTNSANVSKLELALTHVQKRDGSLGRIMTQNLVFVEKRPSKKSVWLNSLGRAGIYSFLIVPAPGTLWVFAGVYGFGSGRGEYGQERESYRPKDISLFEGRELYFKTQKIKK